MDKRCGTCGWWKLHAGGGGLNLGDCDMPVPIAVMRLSPTLLHEGSDCLYWKRKEPGEKE